MWSEWVHTFRGEDDGIIGSRRIGQAEDLGQALGRVSKSGRERAGDALRDAARDDLGIDVGDVGREIVADEDLERLRGLLLEHRVHRRTCGRGGEFMPVQRFQRVGHGVGVVDGLERLGRVEVVDENGDRVGSMGAQKGGELEQEGWIGEDEVEMLAGEEQGRPMLERIGARDGRGGGTSSKEAGSSSTNGESVSPSSGGPLSCKGGRMDVARVSTVPYEDAVEALPELPACGGGGGGSGRVGDAGVG